MQTTLDDYSGEESSDPLVPRPSQKVWIGSICFVVAIGCGASLVDLISAVAASMVANSLSSRLDKRGPLSS